MLQCVTVYYRVLQRVVACCNVMHFVAGCYSVLQCVAVLERPCICENKTVEETDRFSLSRCPPLPLSVFSLSSPPSPFLPLSLPQRWLEATGVIYPSRFKQMRQKRPTCIKVDLEKTPIDFLSLSLFLYLHLSLFLSRSSSFCLCVSFPFPHTPVTGGGERGKIRLSVYKLGPPELSKDFLLITLSLYLSPAHILSLSLSTFSLSLSISQTHAHQ